MKTTSGSSARGVPTTMAEINVTPLVDVMLVLLIVFMISAPLMQQGIQVNLPRANAGSLSEVPDQLVLALDKSGGIELNGKTVKRGQLKAMLEALADAKPNLEVVIQADRALAYGTVAGVMADVKQAKITRVGLVTAPGDADAK